MPTFSNCPPSDERAYALPLARTPANGKLRGIITTNDLVGCATHWFGGRTVPCEDTECKACLEGVPWRWHSYVAAILSNTRLHVLLEFTAQATESLINYRTAHGTLRGCLIDCHRHRNRHNGRVIVATDTADLEIVKLPPEPNVIKALSIIWNLPAPQMDATELCREHPRITFTKPNGKTNTKKEKSNGKQRLAEKNRPDEAAASKHNVHGHKPGD